MSEWIRKRAIGGNLKIGLVSNSNHGSSVQLYNSPQNRGERGGGLAYRHGKFKGDGEKQKCDQRAG